MPFTAVLHLNLEFQASRKLLLAGRSVPASSAERLVDTSSNSKS